MSHDAIDRQKPGFLTFNCYINSCKASFELQCCLFQMLFYRVFQKFVPIVNCILRKALNASLGKCKLIQVRNLSK